MGGILGGNAACFQVGTAQKTWLCGFSVFPAFHVFATHALLTHCFGLHSCHERNNEETRFLVWRAKHAAVTCTLESESEQLS